MMEHVEHTPSKLPAQNKYESKPSRGYSQNKSFRPSSRTPSSQQRCKYSTTPRQESWEQLSNQVHFEDEYDSDYPDISQDNEADQGYLPYHQEDSIPFNYIGIQDKTIPGSSHFMCDDVMNINTKQD